MATKPKGTRADRRVEEVARSFYCAINGGFTDLLTGKENLGATKGRFALLVARELNVACPDFTPKTTLDEAVTCFKKLRTA